MHLRVLGGLKLERSGLSRPKPLLLLAYLALEGRQSRRFLSELFFRDAADPADALSTTVRRLKAAGAVENVADSVAATATCDARMLLDLLDGGGIESALNLYRGAFLKDVPVELGTELEEWVYVTREFIAHRVRAAFLKTAEAALTAGDETAAVARAEAAYLVEGATEPDSDDLLRFLRLFESVDSSVAQTLRQLARSYGIGRERAAAPAGRAAPDPSRQPLPAPPTSLIGRDEELLAIARLLGTRECRLLTLHGPAGVGKSRLALQAASDQQATGEFAGGVVFVPTEVSQDADQLLGAIASKLAGPRGLDDPWRIMSAALGDERVLIVLDSFEHLIAFSGLLRELMTAYPKVMLLVTSRSRTGLIEEWVMPVEGLRIPDDDLPWEDAVLSEAMQLFMRRAQTADVRFQLRREDLPLARRICRAVDGFPLGIELAARCTRLLSLEDLAHSLEQDLRTLAVNRVDHGSRHPSVWGALEHSWNLLRSAERDVLARLAVFRGGFRREAASAVAGATIPVLMQLVDASFLRMDGQGRFQQHALLKQFSRDRLEALGPEAEATELRHTEYYTQLLVTASQETGPGDLHATLRLLQEEEQNIIAGLETAAARHRHDIVVALAEPLLWYFPMTGRFSTGSAILAAAVSRLAQPSMERSGPTSRSGRARADPGDTTGADEAKASLLVGRAWLARYAGSLEDARRLSTMAERHARSARSTLQLLRALDLGGQALTYQGEFDEARALLVEGVGVARSFGDPLRLSRVLCNLALLESITGRHEAAEAHLDEAQEPFDDGRLPPGIDTVAILLAHGVNRWCMREYTTASSVLREAITLTESLSYHGPMPVLNALLAACEVGLLERGADELRAEVSRRLVDEGLQLVAHSRESMATSMLLGVKSSLLLRAGELERAIQEARASYDVARKAGNSVIMLWSLPHLVHAYRAIGDPHRALCLARLLRAHRASPHWLRREATQLERLLAGDQILLAPPASSGEMLPPSTYSRADAHPDPAEALGGLPLDELVGVPVVQR